MPKIDITITGDIEGIDQILTRLNKSWRGTSARIRAVMNEMLQDLEIRTKVKAAKVMEVRSGKLVQSIHRTAVTEGGSRTLIGGVQSSGIPYNRIQEYGGRVQAKQAQYLTIPVGYAKDTGVTAREFISDPSILGFTGSFFKYGIIFGSTPGAGVEPVFILKEEVLLPERSYLRSTLADYRDEMVDRIHQIVEEVLEE